MYSAEPLPHFVDEYLSYLYEVHPTSATFDGVHVHDDLLEDFALGLAYLAMLVAIIVSRARRGRQWSART